MRGKHLLLILVGSISWVLVMVRSGLLCGYGVGFWGPNGHDAVWHIALAESLGRGSLEMPTFAGQTLKNYHVGFDLFLVLLNKLTGISVSNLYFQILPPIIAISIGVLVYRFVFIWKKSKVMALWSTFFVYFGGSFGWIVTFFREGIFSGESMFWSQQAISTLINPPFALSAAILMSGLVVLTKYEKQRSIQLSFLAVVLFGVLIEVKAYAGILALGGLFVAGIYDYLKEGRLGIIFIWLGSLVVSVILFIPLNRNSSNLLVFRPLWFLETMMQLTDRVGWLRYGEAMVNWRYGHVFWKAAPAYFIAFLIFWYGNMGTRLAGEFTIAKWIKNYKKLSFIEIFILAVIFGGVLISTLFLQKGTPWNTIQFFYYTLFFMAILAGIGFSGILEKIKNINTKAFMVFGVIVFTVPTSIITLKNDYLTSRPPAKLSIAEKEALEFLAKQPEGVVLTYPFDALESKEAETTPPRPLYLYVSTAYVSAFAKKPVFLEDEINLDITGYDWKGRRAEVEKFYKSMDQDFVWDFLRRNNISYIYWVKPQRATLGEAQLGLTRIFENKEVDVYKVIE